jgi:ubiquitin-conjugating enzyme E2 R
MTTKLLANQYRSILADPVEGFTVELLDEASLYEWKVYIEGPKDTCYEGGVFQLQLSFPKDYPMSPPVLKFTSDFWHPNVYHDGKVCMSILHPPGEDAMSGELAEERWLPTQSVTTIVLSLMSLLNDPNCSSPANVDASVEWRRNRDSYVNKCRKLVEKANREKPSHVVIPHPDTNEAEHKKVVQKWKEMNTEMDYEDFYEHHEESESDDENENEFLESNEEINSENSEEEREEGEKEKDKKKKKPEHSEKNGADTKEDKGKTPELSLEVVKGEASSKPSSDSSSPSDSPKTDTAQTPSPSATLPPEKSAEPPESAAEKIGSPSSVPPRDVINSPAPVHIPASPSVNKSEEISVDNNNNNNNNASSSGAETKKQKKSKKEKKERKKKCIVM